MATETNNTNSPSYQLGGVAATAILTKGYAVTIAGAVAGAGGGIGIAYKTHAIGDDTEIKAYNNRFTVISGAGFSPGDLLVSNASGKLVTASAANQIVLAIAIGTATAADETVEAWIVSPSITEIT
jgi:hypothetical protein